MRDFLVRIMCIISLAGMLLSLFYCQYVIIDATYYSLKEGDTVLIDPHHTLGNVFSIQKGGKIGVLYTNSIGLSKYIILHPSRLHKVIIINDLTY